MKFEKGQLVMAQGLHGWMPAIYLYPTNTVEPTCHVLWSIKDSVRRWTRPQNIQAIEDRSGAKWDVVA